jgi:uncharacterized iron-regulated protein
MLIRTALPALLALAAGCAGPTPPGPSDHDRYDAVLLGEQHDADAHPRLQREVVESLAKRGRLAALALEMAERGNTTAALPTTATEPDVRRALRWNAEAWPWERYGPVIMQAVRAGVPVLGANLPRDEQKLQMNNSAIDRVLPPESLEAQQKAIRQGHCNMLPEQMIGPLARVQIARDLVMAETIAAAAAPGKTVVLLAGSGHVHRELGVPKHLPQLKVQPVVLPPQHTARDYCEELRRQLPKPMYQ